MQLQSDAAVVEAIGFGVVGEFGSELAVDKELEIVVFGDDMNVIPITFFDFRFLDRSVSRQGRNWLNNLKFSPHCKIFLRIFAPRTPEGASGVAGEHSGASIEPSLPKP